MTQARFIDRIENELLKTLFDYVVPFLDKKTKSPKKEIVDNLESIINNQKPKIEIKDIKELESLLLKNLTDNVKIDKKAGINSRNIFYSLSLAKKKNENKASNKYAISIKYEENSNNDNLKLLIKKDEKEVYSAEITNLKDAKDKVIPYGVKISYEDKYGEERLTITYKQQLKNYLKQHIEDKEDMSNRVPLKWLNILPESMMGGILGFTYLGENFMGRRADLTGKTARMVDIHESIHTPDEYETRVLTSWILEKVRPKYVK